MATLADPTVYLRPPGFPWQAVGRELYRGAYPSSVHVEADSWGFASCSFDLPRDPFLPQPDLSSFVPCRIEEGGAVLFDGKVQETPTRGDPEPLISVSGRGRQYGLDENPIEHSWCHADLSAWKDVRSIGGYDPTVWRPNTFVDAGDGVITMGREKNEAWYGFETQGIFLDLGPDQRVSRIELAMTSLNLSSSTFSFFARGRADDNNISSGGAWTDSVFGGTAGQTVQQYWPYLPYLWSDAIYIAPSGLGGYPTYSGYFNPPARLIALFLYWTGAGGTTALDHMLTINRIALYGSGKHGAQGRGNLRASDVVEDIVTRGSVGITVPEQSFEDGYYYEDELRTGVESIGSNYYSLRLPSRNGATWATVPSALVETSSIIYHDSGGPCLDSNPLGSAWAELAVANRYMYVSSAVWPHAHSGWVVIVWFRSKLGASYTGTDLATLNNRIVATDQAAAVPAGTSEWCAGINVDGKLLCCWRNQTMSTASTLNKYVADGEWHMLYIARNRFNGTINFSLDGTGAEQAYPQSWLGTDRYQANNPTPNLVFGNRTAGDKQFIGDVAEIAWFYGEIPVNWSKHLYHAAKRDIDTPLKRTELVLPGYATSAPRTPREGIEPINALHRYVTKVGSEGEMQFRPQPVRPKYALTAAAARKFEQTSLTAADEAYNRAVIVGQDLFGNPARTERVSGQQPEALLELPDHVAVWNGGIDVDSSGWTGNGAAVTWQATDNGRILVAPSGAVAGSHHAVIGRMLGTFLRGRYYQIKFWALSTVLAARAMQATLGNITSGDYASAGGTWGFDAGTVTNFWKEHTITWIPDRDYKMDEAQNVAPIAWLYLSAPGSSTAGVTASNFYVRDVMLRVGVNSMLDRQNDLRTRIIENGAILTPAIGEAMGDGFLRNRARQQLKGSVQIAPGDIVDYRSGAAVHPSYLPADTMELLHIPSLIDPDTGAQGRDGQMVAVSYDCDTELAGVSIDNSRDNFEVMMQRYAMFAGGGVGS